MEPEELDAKLHQIFDYYNIPQDEREIIINLSFNMMMGYALSVTCSVCGGEVLAPQYFDEDDNPVHEICINPIINLEDLN